MWGGVSLAQPAGEEVCWTGVTAGLGPPSSRICDLEATPFPSVSLPGVMRVSAGSAPALPLCPLASHLTRRSSRQTWPAAAGGGTSTPPSGNLISC